MRVDCVLRKSHGYCVIVFYLSRPWAFSYSYFFFIFVDIAWISPFFLLNPSGTLLLLGWKKWKLFVHTFIMHLLCHFFLRFFIICTLHARGDINIFSTMRWIFYWTCFFWLASSHFLFVSHLFFSILIIKLFYNTSTMPSD